MANPSHPPSSVDRLAAQLDAQPTDAGTHAVIDGRYAIEAALGQGGMGTVYRVVDRSSGCVLALKRLRLPPGQAASERHTELFEREFRVLSQLAHPSVIAVHDYGVDAQGPYYTMELLDGEDLGSRAPLAWRQACRAICDVCSSLAVLHARRFVHRDVSPLNVRCTTDGSAKLLDFGAMIPMGPARTTVGTPPLVPPEALDQRALDGRSDLYSLGGTLYFALTGVHAYPARTLAQLRDLWRTRPAPASKFASDVPPALDALVLSLLSLDPAARPRSAAEVMQRLTTLAGLDDLERAAVPQAYLTTPTLVGREAALSTIRKRVVRLAGGRGGVLLVTGAPGVGRSRLLDACMLEARLGGATALHSGATDAVAGEYAVLRALLSALIRAIPEAQQRAGPLLSTWLESSTPSAGLESDRSALHEALRAWLLTEARRRRLLLVVDDIERADAQSLAALASLVAGLGHEPVLLVLSRSSASTGRSAALSLLSEDAQEIALSALSADEVVAMLSSVFGDVPHLALVATRFHELSGGNPRACMLLAQHMLDVQLARYELGGWALPARLAAGDLPNTMQDVQRARLMLLSADARELADALARSLDVRIQVDGFAQLTSHASAERTAAGLDELLSTAILVSDGERWRFESSGFVEALLTMASAPELRRTEHRIADFLRARAHDPLDVARHLQRAGDDAAANDLLYAELVTRGRWEHLPADCAGLLERAAEFTRLSQRSARERFEWLRALTRIGENLAVANVPAYYAELIATLDAASPLASYRALPADMESGARLQAAFAAAQARFDALPERERVLPPLDAMIVLVRLSRQAGAFSALTLDYALISSLPSLRAFNDLSPAIRLVSDFTQPTCLHLLVGRFEQALELLDAILLRLSEPDRSGLDEEAHAGAYFGSLFALAHVHAGLARADCLVYAKQLEEHPAWLIAAWDVRRSYYLRLGDLREADNCRRQVERLEIADPKRPALVGTSARLTLETCATMDDLTGVKQSVERLDEIVALHPSFTCYTYLARAEHARIRGDYAPALRAAELALAHARPGEHSAWPTIACCQLRALLGLGDYQSARRIGEEHLAAAIAADLRLVRDYIEYPLALAEAKLGETARALERIERAATYRTSIGCAGLSTGSLFEAGAQIAIEARDLVAFERYAKLWATVYERSDSPAIRAKAERLYDDARRAGLLPDTFVGERQSLAGPMSGRARASLADLTDVRTQLSGVMSLEELPRVALELVRQACGAVTAHLYVQRQSHVRLAASTDANAASPLLLKQVEALLAAEVCDDNTVSTEDAEVGLVQTWGADPEHAVRPFLLAYRRDAEYLVIGAAVLRIANDADTHALFPLLATIAQHLHQRGIADSVASTDDA